MAVNFSYNWRLDRDRRVVQYQSAVQIIIRGVDLCSGGRGKKAKKEVETNRKKRDWEREREQKRQSLCVSVSEIVENETERDNAPALQLTPAKDKKSRLKFRLKIALQN